MINLATNAISLSFDPALGLIERFLVQDGGADIAPLHRAPWVGLNEVMPEGIAPHLVKLGGDFFCAPFGSTEGPLRCMVGRLIRPGPCANRRKPICELSLIVLFSAQG